jgi:ABC-type multidrug transport system ATPase subunit
MAAAPGPRMLPVMAAIEVDSLFKSYGSVDALRGVSFRVEEGEVFALLGPNGAGKTTIVRMLATLTRPTSGTATVFGHDIGSQPDAVRSAISLTGQFAALEDNLTARENSVWATARLRSASAGLTAHPQRARREPRTTQPAGPGRFPRRSHRGRSGDRGSPAGCPCS